MLKSLAVGLDEKIASDPKSSDVRLRQDIAKALSTLLVRFAKLPQGTAPDDWLASYRAH